MNKPLRIELSNTLLLREVPSELMQYITRTLKFTNPKWLENERLGRWNRETPKYLKFYKNGRNGSIIIPRGFIRHIILFCRKSKIDYEIDDKRRVLPEIDFTFNGELKPFQQQAVDRLLKKDFGTLSAPTGSGKTVIALHMVAQRRQPALIVVHTKELAYQWVERIRQFLDLSEDEIGFIGDGKRKDDGKVNVALVQSLYKCKKEVVPKIGFIIADECHRAPSRTFTEAVRAFDAKYMLGLSATPWRRDKLSKLIFWHLGDLHHTIDAEELMEQGHILQADIVFRETNFKPWYDPATEYSKMLSELTADNSRNQLIASDVAKEVKRTQGVCLVLSDRRKHCETIQALLKYKYRIDAELLTGDVKIAKRREILERVNKGEVRVLIATGQLLGEGFDCKDLSTLFIATPIRFSGRVIQYLGRILRPAEGKPQPRVFDYVDSQVGPLKHAAKVRHTIYIQHGLEVARSHD